MKSLILSAIFLCPIIGSLAQQKLLPAIRPLTVGDTVPDIEFTNLINYSSQTARLSDFKGKLVILDFWATWCGSCLSSFSKLDSLQVKLKDRLQILLVNSKETTDDSLKIATFFNRARETNGSGYSFPSIFNDSVLSVHFEHRSIPHYVWIYRGVVRGITASHEVTEENIHRILNETSASLRLKKDINIEKPLFINEDAPFENLEHYAVFLKGQIDGLPSANKFRQSNSIIRGRAMTNKSLFTLFYIIGENLIENFTRSRLVLNVEDSAGLLFDNTRFAKNDWYKNNSYSYELVVPVREAGNLYKYMLDDLNKYSDYNGTIENNETICLVLKRKSDFKYKRNKKENLKYPAIRISDLINRLNRLKTNFPIVDETNYYEKIHLPLPTELNDWNTAKKYLNQYGLDLVPEKRKLQMLIIRNKEVTFTLPSRLSR